MKNFIPEKFKRRIRIFKSIVGSVYTGFPAKNLVIIGVTGTSGKSTTANMIYHVLKENGLPVGVISTVGAKAGSEMIDTGLHVTTPEPIQLQKILKFMVSKDIKYVVLECSSHALAQGRLGNLKFDYAVFTNIKRDHLDWHKTWENYASSKAIMIKNLKDNGYVIINRDDKDSYVFLNEFSRRHKRLDKVISYSQKELPHIDIDPTGIKFILDDQSFNIPIIGSYNLENILATITIATTMGIKLEDVSESLKTFRGVKGRMEVIQTEPFLAIVDFAHNTDSLIKSLNSAKELVSQNGKLITVFGSAGLRDVEKRFTMGEAAAKIADIIIATSEDPRTESLFDINSKIIEGAKASGALFIDRFSNTDEYRSREERVIEKVHSKSEKPVIIAFDEESIASRVDAIEFALKIAKPGDVVITEGKGHEMSLCFGVEEYPFTDQEAMVKGIKKLKS